MCIGKEVISDGKSTDNRCIHFTPELCQIFKDGNTVTPAKSTSWENIINAGTLFDDRYNVYISGQEINEDAIPNGEIIIRQALPGGGGTLTLDHERFAVKNPLAGSENKVSWQNIRSYQDILLMAHPVGSYYWSSDDTSPEELFGGTWERIEDTILFAVGDDSSMGNVGARGYFPMSNENSTASIPYIGSYCWHRIA